MQLGRSLALTSLRARLTLGGFVSAAVHPNLSNSCSYDLRFLSIHYGLFIVFRHVKIPCNSGTTKLWSGDVCWMRCIPPPLASGSNLIHAKIFPAISAWFGKDCVLRTSHCFVFGLRETKSAPYGRDRIICWDLRISSVDAPRPIFFDPAGCAASKIRCIDHSGTEPSG